MTENNPSQKSDATVMAVERTYIAHERTLMAWVRTSVSLITFGFSIQQFFRSQIEQRTIDRLLGPREVGLMMMIIGLLAMVVAIVNNRSDMRQLQSRYPPEQGYLKLPHSRARVLAFLVALLGINALLSMALRS